MAETPAGVCLPACFRGPVGAEDLVKAVRPLAEHAFAVAVASFWSRRPPTGASCVDRMHRRVVKRSSALLVVRVAVGTVPKKQFGDFWLE